MRVCLNHGYNEHRFYFLLCFPLNWSFWISIFVLAIKLDLSLLFIIKQIGESKYFLQTDLVICILCYSSSAEKWGKNNFVWLLWLVWLDAEWWDSHYLKYLIKGNPTQLIYWSKNSNSHLCWALQWLCTD